MSNSPSTYWSAKPFLGKLGEAGMLVYCGCNGCRRWRTYLASDLAEYISPMAVVGELWSECPYCKSGANWREGYRYSTNEDVINQTRIRKLKGWQKTAIWADEPFEAPKPAAPDLPDFWKG